MTTGWDVIRFSYKGNCGIKIFLLGCRKNVLECKKNSSKNKRKTDICEKKLKSNWDPYTRVKFDQLRSQQKKEKHVHKRHENHDQDMVHTSSKSDQIEIFFDFIF